MFHKSHTLTITGTQASIGKKQVREHLLKRSKQINFQCAEGTWGWYLRISNNDLYDKLGEIGESSDIEKWEKIALILQKDIFWVTKANMFNTDSQKKTTWCPVPGSLRTLKSNSAIARCHEG